MIDVKPTEALGSRIAPQSELRPLEFDFRRHFGGMQDEVGNGGQCIAPPGRHRGMDRISPRLSESRSAELTV